MIQPPTRPMRIGFISTFPPIECGIATYTSYLREALEDIENETFVISQFGAQGDRVFPIYKPNAPAFSSDVFHTSTEMTPDVMHVQHEYGLYGPHKGVHIIELLLRYRLAGLSVVTTLHTISEELRDYEERILKHVVDESSAVIVHEEFQRETLFKYFGTMRHIKDKTHVIEHGVREAGPVPDAKRKLGLEGRKVVLLCGYFRPSKGLHKIIDAFQHISRRDADAVLVVAGKTRNVEFDDYRRELYTKLNTSPVADRIRVFRGQFPQHTFDTIVSAADVVVLPYESGAQSGVMAQCFANHVPVVASNLRAFNLAIDRSGGGLTCARDEDYVDTILKILNDAGLRRRLKENIRRYISGGAGWSRIARQHVAVYHQVTTVPYGGARYVYFPEPRGETDEGGRIR